MFKSSHTLLAVLSLVLVLILPGALMGKALYDRANGSEWNIKIAGYDPRDLLRGHYLMFTYEWDIKGDQKECTYKTPCCLCLSEKKPGNRTNPDARFVNCTAPEAKACPALIRGKKGWNTVTEPNQTYFVPETHAQALETKLRDGKQDFTMAITVPRGGGGAVIRGLEMNGQLVEDFVRETPVPTEPKP